MSAPAASARTGADRAVRQGWLPATLSVLFVVGMFAAVITLRWRSHFSNVDDYLYALQTRSYLDAGLDLRAMVDAWRTYGTNSPLVPILALPIAAIESSPHHLVLVQVVSLLAILIGVRSLLRHLGSGPRAAWAGSALITTLPPVLGYAAMYHFGLAATACTVAAAAAYLRSERLLLRCPALLLGVAVGLLLLTRVLAPLYVAALCVPLVVEVLAERADRGIRAGNAALAALVAGVLAAPWWLATGSTAVDYLTSVGYGRQDGSPLEIAVHRLSWTATESGWLLVVVVLALMLWAAVCVLRRAPGWRSAAWLIASSLLGLALLGTSSDPGTAFALPFGVLLCCTGVWGMERLRSPLRAIVAGGCIALLVVPALALLDLVGPAKLGERQLWQVGTPGLTQARSALGCDCSPPDTDGLSDQVLEIVGERPVLLARDDALLNAKSLRYRAASHGWATDLLPPPADGKVTLAQLSRADYVLAGGTVGPYHPVDRLAGLLRDAAFRRVLSRRLSRWNSVVVWAAPGAAHPGG